MSATLASSISMTGVTAMLASEWYLSATFASSRWWHALAAVASCRRITCATSCGKTWMLQAVKAGSSV